MEGDKSDMNPFRDFFCGINCQSYAVVNMNYRWPINSIRPTPCNWKILLRLISHLESNRNDYQIGEKVGFVGTSAGGHLALSLELYPRCKGNK